MRKNSLGENITNFGLQDKFDYVLTNPPFGGTENKQIQQNFPVRAQPTELLALQQIMKRSKINGKCRMVVPDGLLSRGDSFAKVKQDLLENYNVHTIISLPAGVFANVTASGQGPKTNLMFFDKTVPTKEIWYYNLLPPNGKNTVKQDQ
jgi:type I restriction enzyme M protein